MDGPQIVHLLPGEVSRPDGLRAGWDGFRLLHLGAGETMQLDAALEHALYVIHGGGHALANEVEIRLDPGIALTLVRGTGASITAGEGGLETFLIMMRA